MAVVGDKSHQGNSDIMKIPNIIIYQYYYKKNLNSRDANKILTRAAHTQRLCNLVEVFVSVSTIVV